VSSNPLLSWAAALLMLLPTACKRPTPGAGAAGSATTTVPAPSASAPADANAGVAKEAPAPSKPDPRLYAWLGDENATMPAAVDTLASRFATPPGYRRVDTPDGSFGHWLRGLPLAAEKTAVKTHKGDVVHDGDDQYLAAVVAIDPGKLDLQQSPDVALRLHAEWLWSLGDKRISYRSATGLDLPLARWARGERLMAQGANVFWVVKGKPAEVTHADFREYLDTVFTWANSISVAQQAEVVEPKDLQPGDFFVHLSSPGHALLVLDIARKPSGQQLALLGQALNPAQYVFVLQAGRGATAWFSLRPGEPIITPYTKEFTWDGLRRLGRPKAE